MPPLSKFVTSVPERLLSDIPPHWLEACIAEQADCLILTDANGLPVQVLHLHQLIAMMRAWPAKQFTEPQSEIATSGEAVDRHDIDPALFDNSAVDLALLTVTTPLAKAVQTVTAAPEEDWLVVDQQQKCLGMLHTSGLLAAALTQQRTNVDQLIISSLSSPPAHSSLLADPLLSPVADGASQQKLSQSNTALLTYLGHELKTPLTSLLGLSSLLKTGHLGNLNPRQTRYISLIQQHCRRLTTWVNTLIDLGRIESGSLRLIPHTVDLAPLWREAYDQVALRMGDEVAKVLTTPDQLQSANSPVKLVADPMRLQQMLVCLMQTALTKPIIEPQAIAESPLELNIWQDWIAIVLPALDHDLYREQLSHMTFSLPFPIASAASTPLVAEMSHWLEGLLVRKLAQLHGGELSLLAYPGPAIRPTLLLPLSPSARSSRDSRFILFVDLDRGEQVKSVQQQAAELSYHILLTHQVDDAVDTASRIPILAVLIFVQGTHSTKHLQNLKAGLKALGTLVIALVPPQWCSMMGNLPADRELLWPAGDLNSALSQPSSLPLSPNRLTILYLKTVNTATPTVTPHNTAEIKLASLFREFGCRVLEVDSIEQAELLRRVWRPNVAVLDPAIANSTHYLQTFSQSPELISLPLVTLTLTATQAAHAFAGLKVFPCLIGESLQDDSDVSDRMRTWLVQVLQAATVRR